MPVYSYICKDCGSKFDLLLGLVSKEEERACKKCGSRNIEKSFVSFGVSVSSGESEPSPACLSCPTRSCPNRH